MLRENELGTIYVPPAASFKPAGRVLAANFSTPPAIKRKRYTGRRLQGVQYEAKVHDYLGSIYGDRYIHNPWIRFFSDWKWRWCQPDALLLAPDRGRITIVEVKYQHTSDAWWQVRHLYQPVLEVMFPTRLWAFDACEVVKWYDPATLFPERTVLAQDIGMKHSHFKVHIWRP